MGDGRMNTKLGARARGTRSATIALELRALLITSKTYILQ
jgi:hypothetical protein